MSTDSSSAENPSERDEIRDTLRRFEELWVAGSPPDVRDWYEQHSNAGLALLQQLVVLNYDLAWEVFRSSPAGASGMAAEPDPVVVYRRKFPELEGDNDLLLELLFLEITNWENPDEEYYVGKYPELAEALRAVFELLKLFRPEQLRSWAGSVSKMARAQADDSHSLLLETAANPGAGNALRVDEASESDSVKDQRPLADGSTIHLTESCRIAGETIGVGAFKRVYQGFQASTGRAVAVKQLMRLTAQGVRNFISEGRAQAGLDHQNIPPVVLLGEQEGQPALLLEKLIRAPDWSAIIRDRSQRSRNLDILLTVSRAAEYAHRECRLVHRDIKPQNVLVGEYREVYLVDWGLAVQVGDQPVLDESVRQLRHEPDGYIIGPPAYMAPEMAMGRNQKCTPATDVFLLGAILYEILSGRPPYDAYPRSACLRAAAHLFPDLPPDTPDELKAITLRAMSRDPQDRFTDAGEFGDALERYLSHQEAENQSQRAESAFRRLREQLDRTGADSGDTPSMLTSLIAAADQFQQAGSLWKNSTGDSDDRPSTESPQSAAETSLPKSESSSPLKSNTDTGPDRFTEAGIERSRIGECKVRERLVSFAIQSGDLALAQSQAAVLGELGSSQAAELNSNVKQAWSRRQRDRRQRIIAGVAALVLLVASLVFWRQQTAADARRVVAEATTEKRTAEAERAQAQRKAAEAIASQQRSEAARELERAEVAESQRLLNQAMAAQAEDFKQASAVYRAASLIEAPKEDAGSRNQLIADRQIALTPGKFTSRRIMTAGLLLSPDGRWLVSTDLIPATIRVWDTRNWMQAFTLTGHEEPRQRGGLWGSVRSLAFHPHNSGVLFSAGMDGTIRRWDLNSREEQNRYTSTIAGQEADSTGQEFLSLTVRPVRKESDSVELVAGRRSGTLLVVSGETLQPIREVPGHGDQITAVEYSLDGKHLATVSSDGILKIWTADFQELTQLMHPASTDDQKIGLHDLAWSPDAAQLAVSGDAASIPVWETAEWTLARTLEGHPTSADGTTRVRELAWPRREQLLSGGGDGVIRMWNPQTGAETGLLNGHSSNMYGRRGILGVTVAPDIPNLLVTAGRDDTIRVWNLESMTLTHSLEGADIPDPANFVPMPVHFAYSASTDQLVTAMPSWDAPARLWDAATLREQHSYPEFPGLGDDDTDRRVQGLALSPDGQRFVTSEINGNLVFWDSQQTTPLKVISGHAVSVDPGVQPPSDLILLAISPDGKHVVSCSSDGMFRLWNADTFEMMREWSADDSESPLPIPAHIRLLDEQTQQRYLAQLRQQTLDSKLAYVGSGQIMTAGRDETIRLWDTEDGSIVRRLELVSRVSCAELNPTGTLLAIGTTDGTLQVHDISDPETDRVLYAASLRPIVDSTRFGQPLKVAARRRSTAEKTQSRWVTRVRSLAFSPGNELLAVTLGDGSLTLIRLSTREIIGRSIGHRSPTGFMQTVKVMFTTQGRLLTIGDDHAIRQWDLRPWTAGRSSLSGSESLGNSAVIAASGGNGWAVASAEGLTRWQNQQDSEPGSWKIESDLITNLVAIPGSDDLLLGTYFGRAIRFNSATNEPVLTFAGVDGQRGFTKSISGAGGAKIAVSRDGMLVASSWHDGQIDIWNSEDGTVVHTIPGPQTPDPNGAIEGLALNPAGTQLAATDFVGTLRIWDLTQPETSEPVFERIGPQQAVGLDYSPDGLRLVQAGLEQASETVVIWDAQTGEKITSLAGHEPVNVLGEGLITQVLDARFSNNGKWLATCGADATVRLWKVSIDPQDPSRDIYRSFVTLSTLSLSDFMSPVPQTNGLPDPGLVRSWVTSLSFDSESRKLAIIRNSGTALVFDLETVSAEALRPLDELYDQTTRTAGIRLENELPVPIETLQLVPVAAGGPSDNDTPAVN